MLSRKQRRKKGLPELARNGPMCDPYSNYHMFRGVRERAFGWLLISCWLPFGVTFGCLFSQKKGIAELNKSD